MADRLCACGCGEPVLATRSDACYASKACQKRRYYAANREKERERARRLYTANREKILGRRRRQYASNPKVTKRIYEYQRRRRLKALSKLGGKCAWAGCGIVDARLLDIHHRNGDGAIERRLLKRNQLALYKKVLEDPTLYQLLCCNHHRLRTFEERKRRRRKTQPAQLPSQSINEESLIQAS